MARIATLYRMVLPDHVCPYGVAAKRMLEDHGFAVDEHLLQSRDEAEDFKAQHDLETTPLVEIDGEPIGGSEELNKFLAQNGEPGPLPGERS